MNMFRATLILILILVSSCFKNVQETEESYQKDEASSKVEYLEEIDEGDFGGIIDELDIVSGSGSGRMGSAPPKIEIGITVPPAKSGEGKSETFRSQLSTGDLAYDIPDEMVYATIYRVILRVDDSLTSSLTKKMSDDHEVVKVEISNTMKAVLVGRGFEIECLSSETQLRKFNRPTTWKWDVTPIKSGKQRLSLTVTCILKRQGFSDESYDLDVFEVEREVKVSYSVLAKEMMADNWKALLGFVVGSGALGWIGNRFRKKRKK